MSLISLLLVSYMLILVLIVLIVTLMTRVSRLEKKLVDINPNEMYSFMEDVRDIVVESERVAEHLDTTIRQRESALEDLCDLVDAKLERYEGAVQSAPKEMNIRERVIQMHNEGLSDIEIAKKAGISVTEVQLVINLHRRQ